MVFFHKLKVGLSRAFNSNAIKYTSAAKQYGNYAEFEFVNTIKSLLPECKVKSNVIISIPNERAEAEIDCLVLLGDRLFAIEVKHWKGSIVEENDGFHQYKKDNYTDDVWKKVMKSPFRQVDRAVSMLKKQTNNKDWIQTIVFFKGADSVDVSSDGVWFIDEVGLVEYMKDFKKRYLSNGNISCFNSCVASDYIYSSALFGERSLHCIIDNSSLEFIISGVKVTKNDINHIRVNHYFASDDLEIHLVNGQFRTINIENGELVVMENMMRRRYSLCKIDEILIG